MTPLPGISAKIVDDDANPYPGAAEATAGYLVLDEPWPAMQRGIWGDMERYRFIYWSRSPARFPIRPPPATPSGTPEGNARLTLRPPAGGVHTLP